MNAQKVEKSGVFRVPYPLCVGSSFEKIKGAGGCLFYKLLISLPEQRRWQHWRPRLWQAGGETRPPATAQTGRSHPLSKPEMFIIV